VLSAEVTPRLDTATWTFTVDGLVERPTTWTWDEIHALAPSSYSGDIHCVTTWSKLDVDFGGVSVDTLLRRPGRAEARFVLPARTPATPPTCRWAT
jgi:DMSO/TMAO reductase YedYZ molybdopterin-dependent catalytic subunit